MTTLIQRSFAGGEIAPALYSRVDTTKYTTGLATCRNFYVMRHGGVQNRAGTEFICEVKDSTKTVRLIPFVFSVDQTYMLEFGHYYVRVIKNGTLLTESSKAITGVTTGGSTVITCPSHGFKFGDEVYLTGIGGTVELNGNYYKVIGGITTDTFIISPVASYTPTSPPDVNSTGYGTYTSGGTATRVAYSSPYSETMLPTLKFVQSADVVTLVNPSLPPYELKRTSDTNWTLTLVSFGPVINPPTGLSISTASGDKAAYTVTALKKDTLEESIAEFYVTNTVITTGTIPSSSSPVTISWSAVTDAESYNIYKASNGMWGLNGNVTGTSFIDYGFGTPDTSNSVPHPRTPFSDFASGPSAVCYYQQRLCFANDPLISTEQAWTSRTGSFKDFSTRTPLRDDDPVTFTLAGQQVNEIRHMIDMGRLILFTAQSEISIEGDTAGILRPGEVNPKTHSYNGASSLLRPLIVNGAAIYVQARGSVVRDLAYEFQSDGYRGNELSIFSAHLVDGYTLTDWAYQQIPHSVVWVVRNDGTLLGLTYVREQQITGWHRHDTDGKFENVCSIPEGSEDAVYLVVNRTINGVTKRYIERMATRQITSANIKDFIGMDCAKTIDGRNTDTSHTMTLSGGTNWDYTETLTLTSSASYFASGDVGSEIQVTGSDGTVIRLAVKGYTSATVVTGKPNKTVPVSMRGSAISNWAKAITQVTGLTHLEGKNVSVFADGFVVANPNNASYGVLTVSSGSIALDKPYAVIHVGLPYISDLETLDIDTPQPQSIADKSKFIGKVTAHVESTRGIWGGLEAPSDDSVDPLENLVELKTANFGSYDDPIALKTGKIDINVKSQWNSDGRVFLRQVDPLPVAILSIAPSGSFPFGG